jgi:hypothetical protein
MSWISTAVLAAILMIGAFVQDVRSNDHVVDGDYCTATAEVAQSACESEVEDDYLIAVGNCTNVSNAGARSKCYSDAEDEQEEAAELCVEQFAAREELCAALGEERYDPSFKAAKFVDPLEIGNSVAPNPYFPLVQGTQWTYQGGGETIIVTVTDETKLIGGVTCLTVNDVVVEDGQPLEDTDDWYAQDKDGNVWYCGEISLNYEIPDGEEAAELVDIEGSWKAFRDHAKPGILMFANPQHRGLLEGLPRPCQAGHSHVRKSPCGRCLSPGNGARRGRGRGRDPEHHRERGGARGRDRLR